MGQREVVAALREAFLAGVRVGRELSTGSTEASRAVGFRFRKFSPLRDPPTPASPIQDPSSSPDQDPDLRSIERAEVDAGETLELFPSIAVTLPCAESARRRARQWPSDLHLTPERAEWARQLGLDAAREWNHFRDHHQSKGTAFLNWDAAWRTWLRRAPQFRRV